MLNGIRSFVARHIAAPAASSPSSPSDPSDPLARDRLKIAACALLLEVAHADDEFTPAERTHIEQALGRHFGLDEATSHELLTLAERERQESIDHYQFTRLINEHYDLGQKMLLAEIMWGVILADGKIATHETYIIRKLANLLELEPAYLSQARRRAADS